MACEGLGLFVRIMRKRAATSDLHYGCTVHSSINAERHLPQRLLDYEETLRQIFQSCQQNGVRVLYILGDVFHTNNPPSTYIARFIALIRRLIAEFGIEVVAFDGNHDWNGKPGLESATAAIREAQIPGLTWVEEAGFIEDTEANILVIPHAAPHDGFAFPSNGKPNIVMCHTTIQGATHGAEETLLADDARSLGEINGRIDVYLTGHIHKPQEFGYQGAKVIYPGSPDRIDFGERDEDKGFVIWEADLDPSTPPGILYKRVPLDVRPFIQKTVVVEEGWQPDSVVWPDAEGSVMKVRVKMREEDQDAFNANEVRAWLLEHLKPNFLTGFEMDIARSRAVRDEGMTERLTMHDAFTRYVERNTPFKTAKDKAFRKAVLEVGLRIIREARDAA